MQIQMSRDEFANVIFEAHDALNDQHYMTGAPLRQASSVPLSSKHDTTSHFVSSLQHLHP